MSLGLDRGVCDGHHDHHVTHAAITDVSLGAIKDPVVPVPASVSADPLQVTVDQDVRKLVLTRPTPQLNPRTMNN